MRNVLILNLLLFTFLHATEEWHVSLRIRIAAKEQMLYFGVNTAASNQFDIGLDSLAPPPAFDPYACLWMQEFPFYLSGDMRPAGQSAFWSIRFFNIENSPVALYWKINAVPVSGQLLLNESLDMATTDSAFFTAPQEVSIRYCSGTKSPSIENNSKNPDSFSIGCYPNPFRHQIRIELCSGQKINSTFWIVNILGQMIRKVEIQSVQNEYQMSWDGTDECGQFVLAGVYFIIVEPQHLVNKLLFIR